MSELRESANWVVDMFEHYDFNGNVTRHMSCLEVERICDLLEACGVDDERIASIRALHRGTDDVDDLHVTDFREDGTRQHFWHRSRWTGAYLCERCGLLPLDPDDENTHCKERREQ